MNRLPRIIRRPLDGVFLLDKPKNMSSNTAMQRVRALYRAAKGGHTGNLDVLATGLLPICLGEGTKFAHAQLEADKTYLAHIRFGIRTTTGDSEGEILHEQPVALTREEIVHILPTFQGEIVQVPPMYSALKHQGKPLYDYARQGIEIERTARRVMIYALTLHECTADSAVLTVHCSKGTYIRTLAEDLGLALGCGGAYLTDLRRMGSGHFHLTQAHTLAQLEALTEIQREALLQPIDCLVTNLPQVTLDDQASARLQQGASVCTTHTLSANSLARVYLADGRFYGLVKALDEERLAPQRLLRQSQG